MFRGEPHAQRAAKVLTLALVGMVLVAASLFTMIAAGLFDPRPLGPLWRQLGPHESVASPDEESIHWLHAQLPSDTFSVRVNAFRQSGDLDIGYGLALGQANREIVVAISPVGYLALWRRQCASPVSDQAGEDPALRWEIPWRTWPHVRLAEESNEIWVDVVDGHLVQVRINRERLWQGDLELAGRELGLWTASFGDASSVRFESIDLFVARP
jgi:hypothetical protein